METMKGRTQRRELSNPTCSTSSLSHSIASHKLHIFTACFIGGAPLAVQFAIKARAVQIKKCLDYLLRRGNGNFEDSEESEDSQSSQETDSSQEVTEHLNPWSRILDEAQECHEAQLNALIDEYKRNRDSENVAHLKA